MTQHPSPPDSSIASIDRIQALLAQDPQLAIREAQLVLGSHPSHRDARLLLGVAQMLAKDFAAAAQVLADLVTDFPSWGQAQLEYGRALSGAGKTAESIHALRRAATLQPRLPSVWRLLADQLRISGDSQNASDAYLQHVENRGHEPHLKEAIIAIKSERSADAERMLLAQLRTAPSDVAALYLLAEIYSRNKRDHDAEILLMRSLALAPQYMLARARYAQVLHRLNRPAEAMSAIETLNDEYRQKDSIRSVEASVLNQLGDYQKSISIYESLLLAHKDNAQLWVAYGHVAKAAGLAPKAISAYRKCLKLRGTFGEPWWGLANLKTFRFSWADVAAMRSLLIREDLSEEDRWHIEFSLGKALEDAGEPQTAFEHYVTANALRRKRHPHDADGITRIVDRMIQTFNAEFFADRVGWGCAAADPLFIIGLPRSGSTLVEQILASHSRIEGTMELPELPEVLRRSRRRGLERGLADHEQIHALGREEVSALGEEYLARTRIYRRSGKAFFVDKLPNNWLNVGLIRLILPNAKIIDVRRHPLACGFSNFKQHFAVGQNFAYDLADLGRYYRDYVRLMAHFDALMPGMVHRVVYEHLIEDTESEIRSVLNFCGLEFEPTCLQFHATSRSVRTASAEQVRRPINREGLDAWRIYDPWLEPLKNELGAVLERYPNPP